MKFEIVSKEQFKKNAENNYLNGSWMLPDQNTDTAYASIKKPRRATMGSAGYDFYIPYDVTLYPGDSVRFGTGIRCKMEPDTVLLLVPRSGLGFKYKLELDNTIGVIDSDYYHSDNEGEISAKITNDTRERKTLILHKGDAFMQGIFLKYGVTEDDDADGIRNGGIGSTGN